MGTRTVPSQARPLISAHLASDVVGGRLIYRPPRGDDELAELLDLFFGLRYPRRAVCPGHVAPFQALADAYFARHPVIIIWASRGMGGKSTLLAGLSLMEILMGANVTILGGSAQQSRRVHEVSAAAWGHREVVEIDGQAYEISAPTWMLRREPTQYETQTIHGNWMRALTASQTSVRGPHPQRLRLDEVDEMELAILDAALGQPMAAGGIPSQTVMSSTLQYADGTFAEVLRRAEAQGFPVYSWCWRETMAPEGWVTSEMVEEAKRRVTARMWELEYELGEPAAEGRAFEPAVLEAIWIKPTVDDVVGKVYRLERPQPEGAYVTAADWAKDVDFTVITTVRYDQQPARVVAWERTQREPWPAMVERFNRRLREYPGEAIHDATGVGGVVEDYLEDDRVIDYVISGQSKARLYSNYVLGIEHGEIACPAIKTVVKEHRQTTQDDLFGRGHTPDSVVSLALAWAVASDLVRPKRKSRLLRARSF